MIDSSTFLTVRPSRWLSLVALVALGSIVEHPYASFGQSGQGVDFATAKAGYAQIVGEELAKKIVPGVSVAWVVDGRIVHAAGYGQAVWTRGVAATAPVRRLSEAALDLLLKAVRGERPGEPAKRFELSPEAVAELAGQYESAGYWARLAVEGNALIGEYSGQPIEVTPLAPLKAEADGRMMLRGALEFERGADGRIAGFTSSGQHFLRVDPARVSPAPEAYERYVGSYGPRYIPLVISVRHGHLYATVENEYDYRLAPLNRVTFNLPFGMYSDLQLVFQTDAGGKVHGVLFANMYLPRRADAPRP